MNQYYFGKYYRKMIFKLAFSTIQPGFFKIYRNVKKTEKYSQLEMEQQQTIQLKKILNIAYNTIPYYNRLFKSISFQPNDVKSIQDLQNIPILTKDIINSNRDLFISKNIDQMKYTNFSTGGTTGTPLKYIIPKYDRFLSAAIRFQWWSWGNYKFGDKVAVIGGSSLVPDNQNFKAKLQSYLQNFHSLSGFDMEEENYKKYYALINKKKPRFFYGYSSALFFFSEWLERENLQISSPKAIFTTSEKLHDNMRTKIEEVFDTEILDGYGLNDGGLQAAECSEHNGYHLDANRSILQLIDSNGNFIQKGQGKAIATSLYNDVMPFINYDTGDILTISEDSCSCGRDTKMLESITGRSVDVLLTPEKKLIHGWFILYLFWEYGDKIKRYQFVQEDLKNIQISIIPESEESIEQINKNLEIIKELIWKRSPNWKIKVSIVDKIAVSTSGKYKFIINKMNSK